MAVKAGNPYSVWKISAYAAATSAGVFIPGKEEMIIKMMAGGRTPLSHSTTLAATGYSEVCTNVSAHLLWRLSSEVRQHCVGFSAFTRRVKEDIGSLPLSKDSSKTKVKDEVTNMFLMVNDHLDHSNQEERTLFLRQRTAHSSSDREPLPPFPTFRKRQRTYVLFHHSPVKAENLTQCSRTRSKASRDDGQKPEEEETILALGNLVNPSQSPLT
ncbi:hypothetical protein M5K25_021184 [Dendrobium thyrsiflorum]|uniref:Uncharacterized protein n=1 Tax=Dendrobium thyrsiflorum TaxID=117978 RepID=A0ABD0UBS8_DENTH